MKSALGYGASTCSYADWIGADLIVFFGSNAPNNQPVTTKYLYYARQRGTQVAVVNPFREPGLERYWVPSVAESALFGTRLADHWFEVHTGGDLAFLVGTLQGAARDGRVDHAFVAEHTTGFEAAADAAVAASWTDIEPESGAIACRHRALRAAARRSAERDLRVVDGAHPARARRRHRPGAAQRGRWRAVWSAGRIAA